MKKFIIFIFIYTCSFFAYGQSKNVTLSISHAKLVNDSLVVSYEITNKENKSIKFYKPKFMDSCFGILNITVFNKKENKNTCVATPCDFSIDLERLGTNESDFVILNQNEKFGATLSIPFSSFSCLKINEDYFLQLNFDYSLVEEVIMKDVFVQDLSSNLVEFKRK